MAKPNVNTASRNDLLAAGVRAAIVDEIIKRRRRKGGINLAMLAELPGVGPATLERLRKALDFEPPATAPAATAPRRRRLASPPAEPAGDGDIDVADAALAAGAEQAAKLVAATTHGDAQMARGAPRIVHDVIEAAETAGVGDASSAVPEPQDGTTALRQAQIIALSVGAQSSFARMLAEVLREQAEENAEATAALARAERLHDVLRLQGDYLRHTLERMSNLNRRWLDLAAKTLPDISSD